MSRKFVQIATFSGVRHSQYEYLPAVIGLADDGTVWISVENAKTGKFAPWEALPDITDTKVRDPDDY